MVYIIFPYCNQIPKTRSHDTFKPCTFMLKVLTCLFVIAGLCGFFDNNKTNDYLTKAGQTLDRTSANTATFYQSWQ